MKIKVLVFPYDKNPYQKLLYGAIKNQYKKQVKISYLWYLPIIGALYIPIATLIKRIMGYRIIHIHWIKFTIRFPIPKKRLLSWYISCFNLWWLKVLRYKIVWTIHNITPHEKETCNDLDIAIRLSKLASIKISHSMSCIKEMKDAGLETSNTFVIPHGTYSNIYPDDIKRSEARKQLHINPTDKVILFFGLIRPYKGVDNLLQAFNSIKDSNSKLIIAGKCQNNRLRNLILNASKLSENVVFYDGYVANKDVATYFNACDVVCLPFKTITTSGSALLAITFGKAIIAPDLGVLSELPKDIGYFYNPKKPKALESSLKLAISNSSELNSVEKKVRDYCESLSWDKIAKQTFEIYKSILV